jgi:hypothetical protein
MHVQDILVDVVKGSKAIIMELCGPMVPRDEVSRPERTESHQGAMPKVHRALL